MHDPFRVVANGLTPCLFRWFCLFVQGLQLSEHQNASFTKAVFRSMVEAGSKQKKQVTLRLRRGSRHVEAAALLQLGEALRSKIDSLQSRSTLSQCVVVEQVKKERQLFFSGCRGWLYVQYSIV